MKCKGNKGAIAIGDALGAITFIIVAAIITYFAYQISVNAQEREKNLEVVKARDLIDANRLLTEYISLIDDNGEAKSDAIRRSYQKNDFNLLRSDIKNFFDKRIGQLEGWRIAVLDNEGNEKTSVSGGYLGIDRAAHTYKAASVFLPQESGYIILRLYYGREPAPRLDNVK